MKKKQPIQATLPRVAPAKKPARKAKPAKKPAARPASPPMIRLRLPSEKPTREDADKMGEIATWGPDGVNYVQWDANIANVYAWAPGRLPDGILPREPSQEEKLRQEGEKLWPEVAGSMTAANIHDSKEAFLQGILAAKKGGAE